MMVKRMLLAATMLAAAEGTARAEMTPAQMFGAREDARQISLSPDGKRIAMIRSIKGAGSALYVADLTADAALKPILSSTGRPDRLQYCMWATSTRLVCDMATTLMTNASRIGYTRMLTLTADGSGLRELTGETAGALYGAAQYGGGVIDLLAEDGRDNGGQGGAVLVTRNYRETWTTGTLVGSTVSGLGVERVDTLTLRRQPVERGKSGASEYITDGHGTVRIMALESANDSGMLRGRTVYLYRKAGSREWLPLSTVTDGGGLGAGSAQGFDPYAVDRDLNAAYGFDRHDGRAALYRVSLDGSMKRELLLDNAAVDVDGLIRVGRQRRVVGASYATERRHAVFFDPEIRAMSASLGRALPKHPSIEVVDASADEQQLILRAGSDVDAGRFYLFDKKTRKLTEISPIRPPLEGLALATVKSVTYKAADGTMIPGYLTLPPGSDGKGLPAIVMPHGGPEARDEWGFDWLSQFFANRGYAVLQPNFRGSSGYGQAWFQKNGFQSWRTAIGDVDDAGRYLLASGIAAPGKLAIFGWSYGGYAALQSSVLDPDLFKAIVAVAPVTDLETLRGEHRDYTDYRVVDTFIGRGAHIREGSPAQNVDRIKAPVLMFHGDQDQNVGVGESRLMAAKLRGAGKQVEYVEYKGLTHQLDDSDVRAEMLGKSDAFLRKAIGLKG